MKITALGKIIVAGIVLCICFLIGCIIFNYIYIKNYAVSFFDGMVGESGRSCQKNVYRYYKCITAKRKKLCDKKPVRKEWIEQVCVEKALKVLNDDALLDVLTDRIYELQAEENPRLPYLKEQLSDVEKKIKNILSAIEQGAFSDAINERLSSLEKSKKDIETAIIQEQIKRPFLTKEQIRFGIEKFKTLDIDTQEGRQRLIDGFINAVYLYDDKITIVFNYKDSTTTVSIDEYKSSDNKTKTAPSQYNPNYLFTTSEWFGFTFYLD